MQISLDDVANTWLQGHIVATYKDLVLTFGEPTGFTTDKTDVEFWLKTPAGVATIYNYKDGKNYLGASGINHELVTWWHVGGRNKEVVELIRKKILRTQQKYEAEQIKRLYKAWNNGLISGREFVDLVREYLVERYTL